MATNAVANCGTATPYCVLTGEEDEDDDDDAQVCPPAGEAEETGAKGESWVLLCCWRLKCIAAAEDASLKSPAACAAVVGVWGSKVYAYGMADGWCMDAAVEQGEEEEAAAAAAAAAADSDVDAKLTRMGEMPWDDAGEAVATQAILVVVEPVPVTG